MQLLDDQQQTVAISETLVIANAFDCKQFSQTRYLPLRKLRGQITQLPATAQSSKIKKVICGEGYITPATNGSHSCGATYNKDLFTTELREQDHPRPTLHRWRQLIRDLRRHSANRICNS